MVDAAPFFNVGLGVVLPILLRLAYVLSFTTARVDAAFFNAVGMDVALPLYCGYGRYCPFTAANMGVAFYTAGRVAAASFFGCWWTLTLFIGVDAEFIYCS